MTALTLRDYQLDTHAALDDAEARGVRAPVVVAATGLGKTVIFTSYAEKRAAATGQRTLVLAHRDELITQAAAKVLDVWPDLGATETVLDLLRASGDPELRRMAAATARNPRGVGIVKAQANDVLATVVVASVQTLARPKRLGRLLQPMDPTFQMLGHAEPFGLVVVDECHHATADTYVRIIEALHAGQEGGPLLLGVTATPDRGDGKGLDKVFTEVVASWDLLWGIRAGYLSELRGLRVTLEHFDPAAVRVSRGDYDQGQAGKLLTDAGAPAAIVAAWRADHPLPDGTVLSARDRRTLVFTPTVELARHVAAEFVGHGVSAAWVSGETPLDERRQLLRDFRNGAITVLANCAVLTEGYDEPAVQCVVVARPTKSRALYTQMVGRGTRRHPDKDHCLVLDVVGATNQHSLVTVPSLFGIDAQVREYHDGEAIASAVAAQERELVRLGRMRAEEADLFAQVRAAGLAWVGVHTTADTLRRFQLSLGRGTDEAPLPLIVLAQRVEGEDVWTAGLQWPDGAKQVLIANTRMETAQGVAEDYVRKEHAAAVRLVDANAAWRTRKPTDKQLAAAAKWRLKVDPKWNAGQLSDAMNQHIGRINAGKARR